MLHPLRKLHEPCDGLIESLRQEIAGLQERLRQAEEGEKVPVIQMSSRRGAQRAAPSIHFSQRPLPAQPLPKTAVVGIGMMIKDEGGGRMRVTQVTPGGGACDSGAINVGDRILAVAPSPDDPLQTPQVTKCVKRFMVNAACFYMQRANDPDQLCTHRTSMKCMTCS